MGKVSVSPKGRLLYLSGRFPNKDGSPGTAPRRIATGLSDTPANWKTAEKRAKLIERQLATGTFDWADWTGSTSLSWKLAIEKLHQKKVVLGKTSQSTWEVNYMGRLKQIPPTSDFTAASMESALGRYRRDQCSYKELYYLLKHMAQLCGVPFPEVPVPTYGKARLKAVPSDNEIVEWVQNSDEVARWYFGMLATYGLRPHEIEGSKLLEKDRLQVSDKTKTGFRTVVPLHPEWVELFDLRTPKLREVRDYRRTSETGRNDHVTQFLHKQKRKMGIRWQPYALRHAYAARLWSRGGSRLDLGTAAALMGHSVKIHMDTYRAHIDPHVIAETAEKALGF